MKSFCFYLGPTSNRDFPWSYFNLIATGTVHNVNCISKTLSRQRRDDSSNSKPPVSQDYSNSDLREKAYCWYYYNHLYWDIFPVSGNFLTTFIINCFLFPRSTRQSYITHSQFSRREWAVFPTRLSRRLQHSSLSTPRPFENCYKNHGYSRKDTQYESVKPQENPISINWHNLQSSHKLLSMLVDFSDGGCRGGSNSWL